MKKLATMCVTALFLLSSGISGYAQNQPPPKDEKAPVVGVKIGDDPNAPTSYLRLEYQLRILAYYNPDRMTVDRVFPGGPATKLLSLPDRKPGYLEPGDVITHVDGRRIHSMTDYYQAMYLSGPNGGKVKLTVIDVNSGNTMEFEARAERVGGGRARVKPLGDAKRATKVKALLIAATADQKLADGASENLRMMQQYVSGLPNFNESTDLIVLKAQDLNSRKIMQTIESLDVGPTETLFCYIACHGAQDDSLAAGDPSGGHFFQLIDGNLTRRSVFTALADCGGQLTVLITDTCNVPAEFVPPKVQVVPPGPIESKLLTELLYGYEGVIDVSGSSKGQYGWYSNLGGMFTRNLLGTLQALEQESDVDWKRFLDTNAANATATYQAWKKAVLEKEAAAPKMDVDTRKKLEAQADQRPQAFQLTVKRVQK